MDLNDLRKEINDIDKQMLELFIKRMGVCYQVAQYKIENNLPVFQGEREKEIINRVVGETPEDLSGGARVFFQTMMDISKCKQYQTFLADKKDFPFKPLDLKSPGKVAVAGTNGSFTHAAAEQIFKNSDNFEPVFLEEFSDVFKAVEQGETKFGVVPISNTTAGSVTATYELLRKFDLKIAGMTKVKVSHCLAAKKGSDINNIEIVYSHEHAINQCSKFLKKNGLKAHNYTNTATAAKYVSECEENYGAICSEKCANDLGLEILQRDIANASENYTKFILISKETLKSEEADIISLCLALPHTSSSLYKLLTKFSVAGLNLIMIESRPIANTDFDVFFYLDFNGAVDSPDVARLLSELESELSYFKFLGNYEEI